MRKQQNIQMRDDQLNAPWLINLIENFEERVIDPLSVRARAAAKANENIEEKRVKIEVRGEIVRQLCQVIWDEAETIHELQSRKLVEKLAEVYPAMYQGEDPDGGYGLGGKTGNQDLPKQICSRLFGWRKKKRDQEEQSRLFK